MPSHTIDENKYIEITQSIHFCSDCDLFGARLKNIEEKSIHNLKIKPIIFQLCSLKFKLKQWVSVQT